MAFFLIVPSVIIISIFLVYGITSRIGLKIRAGVLVMCAVLSILADVGAVKFFPILDKWFFVRPGIFILVAAMLLTAVNYILVRREETEAAEFSEQVKSEYQSSAEKAQEVEPQDKEEVLQEVTEEKIFVPPKTSPPKISPPEKIQPVEKVTTDKKAPADKKVEPIVKPEKIEPVQKVEPEKKVEPVKVLPSQPPEKIDDKKVSLEKKFYSEEDIETLDAILDYAYEEKNKGNNWRAIAAYKKALEKYNADEYAPFVAIDLGNIYKEQASYTKAIRTYEDALNLPAVRRNAAATAEFKRNISYLRIVQSVLMKHRALSTPFSKISREYLQEVETEFQAAQLSMRSA